jgi:acyl carrier protein
MERLTTNSSQYRRKHGRSTIDGPFMSNREKEVIAIVSDVSGFDEAEITPESNFAQDLEIDSIKAIEITVALEKKFKISVRDEDVPNITTVKQAVELVNRLTGQNS